MGQLLPITVADTEEKAEENARQFMWMQGEFTGLTHPVWAAPSGYLAAARRASLVAHMHGRSRSAGRSTEKAFEERVANGQLVYGTPDQVVRKVRAVIEQTRPGILALWGTDGRMTHDGNMRCIALTGREVLPALREMARELELPGPFEAGSPVSLAATPAGELQPVEG